MDLKGTKLVLVGGAGLIGSHIVDDFFDKNRIHRITQKSDRTSVFAQYTILVDNREQFQTHLAGRAIPTTIHYPKSLNQQPAYMQKTRSSCTPNAVKLSQQVLSLPMGADLNEGDQDLVFEMITACSLQFKPLG